MMPRFGSCGAERSGGNDDHGNIGNGHGGAVRDGDGVVDSGVGGQLVLW